MTNTSNIKHIDISYTGSNEGDITTVVDNVIARAEPINGPVISTVEFSLDAVNWLQAVKENGETAYKVSLGQLSEGAHALRVKVNGITQHGLIEVINIVPEPIKLLPEVMRFGWYSPEENEVWNATNEHEVWNVTDENKTTIEVGNPITFYWQIDNVAGCTSIHSGQQDSAGSKGPLTYYGQGTTSLTKWTCTDLEGNRFPEGDEFLEATKIVVNPSNLQHISVSFKNNNDTEEITTINKLIATAKSIDDDTVVETASFRVVAAGEIIAEVSAEKKHTTKEFISYFPESFELGNYVLQVAINGLYQGGLDTYFTINQKIISIHTDLLGTPVTEIN